jgi:hypothetical protein
MKNNKVQEYNSPKEKAEELIDKFTQTNGNSFFAKECALITVDEILTNFGALTAGATFYTSSSAVEFYYEVKQEIEKS